MFVCRTHDSCISKAVLKAEKICADRGVRFTRLRRRVLELVWGDHVPVKAYVILEELGDGTASVKPPTVYRTLGFLLENGLVHKIDSLNAYVGCNHPLKHDECYFLYCSSCREIKECCSDDLNRAIGKVASRNKFKPRHTTLEISGECHGCRRGKA